MKTSSLLLAVLCLLLFSSSYAQNVPKAEKDIPIYPGAVIDIEAQKQAQKDYQEIHEGQSVGSYSVKVYYVSAVPDDVCRFYINKLGAKEGFPEDGSGETKPWYEVNYFPSSWFDDQYEGNIKIHDGKWLKSALMKRKQWAPGEWLQGAYFEWEIALNNGDMVRFSIDIIDDDSFDTRAKKVSDRTQITITSQVEESE